LGLFFEIWPVGRNPPKTAESGRIAHPSIAAY
jgi:hypothetical protein